MAAFRRGHEGHNVSIDHGEMEAQRSTTSKLCAAVTLFRHVNILSLPPENNGNLLPFRSL